MNDLKQVLLSADSLRRCADSLEIFAEMMHRAGTAGDREAMQRYYESVQVTMQNLDVTFNGLQRDMEALP
jgi:hypothetical protein